MRQGVNIFERYQYPNPPAMALFLCLKEFEYQRFWVFVVVYYLFTLALEMVLIVRGAPAGQAQPKN